MKKFIILFAFCSYSYPKIVSYNFENTLDNSISGFDATYIENGANSNNTPLYTSGETGLSIALDSMPTFEW